MANRSTVLVIGGGPNGLAAAARLAAAGRPVTLLEARPVLGGLAAGIEFHPGFTAPGVLHDDGLVSDFAVATLGLTRHGLSFRPADPVRLAGGDSEALLLDPDARRTATALAARSPRDAAAWTAYRAFFARLAPLRRKLLAAPPPPLAPSSAGDRWRIARRALDLLRLGRRDVLELVRVVPMCVADFLNERFETPLLIEGLAAPAVLGTRAGPWSAGTTANLLLAETAPARRLVGGPPALVRALEAAARAAGARLRTGARVARIRVDANGVAGVTLADGEELAARCVLATCDPKRTMLELVEPGALPLAVEEEFRRVRARGTAAKVHLALDGPLEPAFEADGRPCDLRLGGGHVDQLERAFDASKYRRTSERPQLDVRVPSRLDPTLAPAGAHVVSVLAGWAPNDLAGGWSDGERERFGDLVVARLAAAAPGLSSRILARQVLTPADLERDWHLTGGQLHHVEPALDQLFVMRPTASAARYATAVPGLLLGGSGCHAGGGLTCDAGLLAATAALRGTRGSR